MLQTKRAASRCPSNIAGLALAWCLLALAPELRAAGGSEWLRWSAPAECQNTAEVERRLRFLLGRPVDFATLPSTRVSMGWSAARGWAVRVTVELDAGSRARVLDAPSCADAFDVIALSLALILDPNLEVEGEAPLTESSEGASADALTELVDATVEVAQLDAAKVIPTALELPAGTDAANEAAAVEERTRSIAPSVILGGAALTDIGVFPVPQYGGAVQLGLRLGRARVEVEANAMASQRATFAGAEHAVSFSSLLGGLRGCYGTLMTERLEWLGCAGGELGSLGARELGGDERLARGLWLAAQALTGPEFAATEWLRAFVRFRAVAPLLRHEFLLSEGSRVHELPWVSLQFQVGIVRLRLARSQVLRGAGGEPRRCRSGRLHQRASAPAGLRGPFVAPDMDLFHRVPHVAKPPTWRPAS